jgi:hypothetical protein
MITPPFKAGLSTGLQGIFLEAEPHAARLEFCRQEVKQ